MSTEFLVSRRDVLKTLGILPFWARQEFRAQEILASKEVPKFRCYIAYYHGISNTFEGDLNFLTTSGLTPITLPDLVAQVSDGTPLPGGDKSFLIIFDDGLKSQYTVGLPILRRVNKEREEFGLPKIIPAFAVMTQFDFARSIFDVPLTTPSFRNGEGSLEYLNKGEIIEIQKEGYPICNHTYQHKDLGKVSADQVYFEIMEGEKRIRDLCELAGKGDEHLKDGNVFVYPYGLGSGRAAVLKILTSLGYWAAFTTNHDVFHTNSFQVGRIASYNLRKPQYSEFLRFPQPVRRSYRCRDDVIE